MTDRYGSLKYALNGVYSGGTPTAGDDSFYSDEGAPFVTIGDMSSQTPILLTKRHLSETGRRSKNLHIVEEGTVLLSMYATIGLPNVLGIDACISQAIIALFNRKDQDARFLYWWLMHYRGMLEAEVAGSTQGNLNAERVKNIRYRFTDLATQRQIADFLDRETARIDLLIEKKQRLVALLGERVTCLIAQATMHGMKDEDYTDTGIDWWFRAPASWKVHRMASLFRESKEKGEEGLPVLSVSINWGISDRELADEDRDRIVNLIEDKTSYKRVRPGDLVYNMMRAWQGAFGVAKVDGLVSPAYVVARPRKGLHSAYFEHLLRTPSCVEEFRRASKGIADFRQRLYWEHFRQVQLVIPTFEEQVEIAAYIESEQAQIAPTVSKTQESIDRLNPPYSSNSFREGCVRQKAL